MPGIDQLLSDNGIFPKGYKPGRQYLTCPKCSSGRKKHNQKKPCLSLMIEADKAYWKCHHCGWSGPEKSNGKSFDDRIRYAYPNGNYKVRNPKGRSPPFIWEHEDDHGNIVSGSDGLGWSLYKLDEAIEHGGLIAIVEGEKDADNLWLHGIPAITSPHGAAQPGQAPKWTQQHSEQLLGLDIVVLNDNDPAGYEHAKTIVELSTGYAKSIRRLDLKDFWPDIPPTGDVSDFLSFLDQTTFPGDEWLQDFLEDAPLINGGATSASSPRAGPQPGPAPGPQPGPIPQTPPTPPGPYVWTTSENWHVSPPEPPGWTVKDLIPRRRVTLFSGHGAAGKSTVALHLAAAHVIGRPWLNFFPEPGPAFFVDAEDELGIMCQRLQAIADFYEGSLVDFEDLKILSLADKDALLATANRGVILPTKLFLWLEEEAKQIKPQQIVIASSANVFAGNEIDRSQVTQFIGLLNRLAVACNGSVILIAHPSLTGMATDTGLSGSTGWHNAVRSQMYLKGIKDEESGEENSNLRLLEFKKNQYGKPAASLGLEYKRGMFLPTSGGTDYERAAQETKADHVFRTLLAKFNGSGRAVSDRIQARDKYAPKAFAQEPEAKLAGLKARDLEEAMRRAFSRGQIRVSQYGAPSRNLTRIEIVP